VGVHPGGCTHHTTMGTSGSLHAASGGYTPERIRPSEREGILALPPSLKASLRARQSTVLGLWPRTFKLAKSKSTRPWPMARTFAKKGGRERKPVLGVHRPAFPHSGSRTHPRYSLGWPRASFGGCGAPALPLRSPFRCRRGMVPLRAVTSQRLERSRGESRPMAAPLSACASHLAFQAAERAQFPARLTGGPRIPRGSREPRGLPSRGPFNAPGRPAGRLSGAGL